MKTVETILLLIAIVALIGIAVGRFLMGASTVLGFSAGSLISVVNTILLLSIVLKLRSK